MLVDDNASRRQALNGMIARLGYDVVEADSGMAALGCLAERDFTVIVLDVRMPVMDGYTTASLIRQRRNSEMTPIIFATENDRDLAAEAKGHALSAVDFIYSPFEADEVRAKFDTLVSRFSPAELEEVEALTV